MICEDTGILRVLGTLSGRRDDSQYNRASREEAASAKPSGTTISASGPRGHAEYHHISTPSNDAVFLRHGV